MIEKEIVLNLCSSSIVSQTFLFIYLLFKSLQLNAAQTLFFCKTKPFFTEIISLYHDQSYPSRFTFELFIYLNCETDFLLTF